MGEGLNESQITVIRTLWELAQSRIDDLYSIDGAEEEKQAMEDWITKAFPDDYDEFVRAGFKVLCNSITV